MQELLANRTRVSLVEPGTVDTELGSHKRWFVAIGIVSSDTGHIGKAIVGEMHALC